MTPPYINRVWQQGRVTSTPTIKSISSRTKVTAFQISTVETWKTGDGTVKERKNRVQVEVVGRDAEKTYEEVKLGSWVTLEGYIRSEQFKGQDLMKLRTLSVHVWSE